LFLTLIFTHAHIALFYKPYIQSLGVIGASAQNGAGIRGIISDDQLCLVLSRIFTSNGSSSVAKVVEAMLWTIEQGVQVLNLSLGTEIEYQAIKETVDYAEQQGILLIASAGYVVCVFCLFPKSME
jgi:minor extracellular protease Epr